MTDPHRGGERQVDANNDDNLFALVRRWMPNMGIALGRAGVRAQLAAYLRGGAGSDAARRRRNVEDLHRHLGDVLADASIPNHGEQHD